MQKTQSPILLWVMVLGIFAGLLAIIIPQVKSNITTLSSEVSDTTGTSLSSIENEWVSAQKEFSEYTDSLRKNEGIDAMLSEGQLAGLIKEIEAHTTEEIIVGFPENENAEEKKAQQDAAKTYCTQKGGRYDIRKGPGTIEYEVCMFDDRTECVVQDFYNGECGIGQYRKAEDGIKKEVDLVVQVEEFGYCTKRTRPIQWVDEGDGSYVCLDGMKVHNMGWKKSPVTQISIGGPRYSTPSLTPGTSHEFSSAAYIRMLKEDMVVVLEVDPDNTIEESNEKNNTFRFPN